MEESELADLIYLNARLDEITKELMSSVEELSDEQRDAFAAIFACKDTLYYLKNSVSSVTLGTWPIQPVLDGRKPGKAGGLETLLLSPTFHRLLEADRAFDVICQTLAIHAYNSAARELRSILEGLIEAAYIDRKMEGMAPRERAATLLEVPNEWRRFGNLLKRLDLEASDEIGKLYGDLSSFVHPNYAEFVNRTMQGELDFVEKTQYDIGELHEIVNLVQRTTDAVAYTVLERFPEAGPNFLRKEKVQTFVTLLDLGLIEREWS